MCPTASARWCPTPEQLMILEEMYRSGIRTPNAAQIQQITAHLSFYGRIEGKNVFYWFQNHKARDRQKLRKKLSKQLQLQQQQQQLLYHPLNNSYHHHFCNHVSPALSSSVATSHVSDYCNPSSASSLPQGGGHEEASSKVMMNYGNNNAWKMDIPAEGMEINMENPVMESMYGRDWMMMMMMMDVGVPSPTPCCSIINTIARPPLKTLELFPITSSNFKEDPKSPSN